MHCEGFLFLRASERCVKLREERGGSGTREAEEASKGDRRSESWRNTLEEGEETSR